MIVALIIPAMHSQKKTLKKTFNKTNQCRDFVREIYASLLMGNCHFVFGQDLLQLQYEGVAVMKMFGRAKINVNLLIFLLNKKFYGK